MGSSMLSRGWVPRTVAWADDMVSITGELQALSDQLARMSDVAKRISGPELGTGKIPSINDRMRQFLHASLKADGLRNLMLGNDERADPSWGILLRMMLARMDGIELTENAIGIENDHHRFWLKTLILRGMIERGQPCNISGNPVTYRLTAATHEKFLQLFDRCENCTVAACHHGTKEQADCSAIARSF